MRKRYNKILIIIIAIVLLYIVWIKVRPMTHNRDARYEPILMSEEDTQKYIEQSKEKLSEKASDIEGWSLLDKVDAGLGIHDGSDTDG
ncbi:MAG: hypothetical protein IJ245_09315, partial [Lachnospiraceae bacterium]|nr:hypothetical protein [Lachnospiraceae bacterium]